MKVIIAKAHCENKNRIENLNEAEEGRDTKAASLRATLFWENKMRLMNGLVHEFVINTVEEACHQK